ncbi:MAG: 2-iminoacetate synthase ThiH [Chitinispirillaceae bacterium]|nr:2-iminoacetate synthase ThiH [Chitinispirillaceae bacterium]
MSFAEIIDSYCSFDIEGYCASVTPAAIDRIIDRSTLSERDFLALLSDAADERLEATAQKAAALTRLHFGSAIVLFTPMYISNYCDNICPYCSFAHHHDITRSHLSLPEIEQEAKRISAGGIRHILVLTGESPSKASVGYLEEAVRLLRNHFSSVAIEIYPLSQADYARLIAAGADMLTLYQETYDKPRYARLHPSGAKADYRFRLDAQERSCRAGMRAVTVGALYGLHDWRSDAFFAGLHAAYLQRRFPAVEIAASFPRLRPLAGDFSPSSPVGDRQFVRMMTALRCFLPTVGITISTRESAKFRMSLLPLGVTRISAGVSTSVGGHGSAGSTAQFEIADTRDVPSVKADLLAAGFQPVMHDWSRALTG